MIVQIKKKESRIVTFEKNGVEQSFNSNSLFVSCDDMKIYPAVCARLKKAGATESAIAKFSTPSIYEGVESFAFWLNCSAYTFANVQKFGFLDAKIDFTISKTGSGTAKIVIIDRIEQVDGYEASKTEVKGWNIPAPVTPQPVAEIVADQPPITSQDKFYNESPKQNNPLNVDNGENPADDLPF